MLSTATRLPLVVAVETRTMELGMPMPLVLSAAVRVSLTQTAVAAVVPVLRMEAVVVKAELVAELTSWELHRRRFAHLLLW